MKNGSRSEYYLVEGGLKMTRMRQSEWRRRWGIQGVVAFDAQVTVSGDDGYSRTLDDYYDSTEARLLIGQWGGAIPDSWARWDNVTIPAGATIQAANISVNANSSSADGAAMLSDLHFSDEDDPAAPTTRAEHVADPRTTASTAWDAIDFVVDVFTDSPDISAVIQEIVDRGGWNSGQAMMLLWEDGGTANGNLYQISSYDDATDEAMKLHVEYSA